MSRGLRYRLRQAVSVLLVVYVGLMIAGGLKQGTEPVLAALPWLAFSYFCLAMAVYPWRGKGGSDKDALTIQPAAQLGLEPLGQSTTGIKRSSAPNRPFYLAIATILVLQLLYSQWLGRSRSDARNDQALEAEFRSLLTETRSSSPAQMPITAPNLFSPTADQNELSPREELDAMLAEDRQRPTPSGPSGENVPDLFSPTYDAVIQAQRSSESGTSAIHEARARFRSEGRISSTKVGARDLD